MGGGRCRYWDGFVYLSRSFLVTGRLLAIAAASVARWRPERESGVEIPRSRSSRWMRHRARGGAATTNQFAGPLHRLPATRLAHHDDGPAARGAVAVAPIPRPSN